MQAKRLAHEPFDPVSSSRQAYLFLGDRQTESGGPTVAGSREHGEVGIGRAMRPCKYVVEVGC